MSSKAYQEVYPFMTEEQKDIMHDLYMKAVNHDGHSWNMFCDIEDAVAGIVKAQQWIPCSERMPFVDEYGKSDQVLATCGLRNSESICIRWLRILYFNGCNWCFPTSESYEQMVYAWMPLPKPYHPEGENSERHDQ